MRSYKTVGFVLLLCITALFFAFETAAWAMPEDASCYIRLSIKETNVYTEENVRLQARLQVQRSSRKPLDLPYSIKVYRYDLNNITEYLQEEKQTDKVFKEFKGDVSFRFREHTWETEVVEHLLKELPSGYYRTILTFGNDKTETVFHVSRLGIIVKTDDKSIITYVQDKKTGHPIPDAQIMLIMDNKLLKTGKTDETGFLKVDKEMLHIPKDSQNQRQSFVITAALEEDFAFCSSALQGLSYEFKGYIYTDRPVYRPGQKVYYKGILREKQGADLIVIKNQEVNITLLDPKNEKLFEKTLNTGDLGSISGEFELSEDCSLGNYRINIDYKDSQQRGSFKVEEYRKPEFEVKVTPAAKRYLQGEEAEFHIEALYYFGAPVANAEYTFEVYQQRYMPFYSYFWWEDSPYYSYGSQYYSSGEGKTDDKGQGSFSFKLPKLNNDSRFTVSVKMTDESRRQITGSASMIASVGEYSLTVSADKYFYSPMDTVKLKVSALDYEGQPQQAAVEAEITRSLWVKNKYERAVIFQRTFETDKEGNAQLEFIPKESGHYIVKIQSKDSLGNVILTSTNFYCADRMNAYGFNPSSVEIKPDKSFYEYNEPVSLMILTPDEGSTVLFTLEGDEIYESRVMELKGSVNTLELQAFPQYAPNVFAVLTYWKDGKVVSSSCRITIPAKDKFLKVEIETDQDKYEPRNEAVYTIRTVKEDGTPVSAEAGMGVADESLYAVEPDSTPKIQPFFYGVRRNRVAMASSFIYNYYGYFMEENEAPMGAIPPPAAEPMKSKIADGDDDLAEPDFIREFFPDTCYFNPSIITDETGTAKVTVPLPDSLTTWRATVRAASKKTEVGEAIHKVIVTKDLLVRLIMPRYLVEKDQSLITALVHNYLETPVQAHVSLTAEGVELLDKEKDVIDIEPSGRGAVNWKVKTEKAGNAQFTIKALTKIKSDAMTLPLPLHPHGIKVTRSAAGSTKDNLSMTIDIPDNVKLDSSTMKITLSSSLAGSLISALEYLAQYPYGCTEQTMNRFIPNAAVQSSLKELGIKNPKLEEELPKMMKKGIERITDFQHSDGGWGWWKNDSSHPYMTSYVVYGLSLAVKAGYEIDKDMIKSGADWIQKNYDSQKSSKTKAFMLFSLSEAEVYDNKKIDQLFKSRDQLDSYSKGILAIAAKRSGNDKIAGEIIHILSKEVEEKDTFAFWKGSGDRSWTDSAVETTAYVIKAYLMIKPDSPLTEKGVRFLTVSRRGSSWSSTKDTAAAVLTLIDYAGHTGEMDADFEGTLHLQGKPVKDFVFKGSDAPLKTIDITIPGSDLSFGGNTITAQITGKGRLYCTASVTAYTLEDLIKAESRGINIKREYFLVKKPVTNDKKEKTTAAREELIPLDTSKPINLQVQDIIEVKLTIESDVDNEYLIVEDMKPAGCEADKEEQKTQWDWWYSQREYRDEKVVFFSTYFNKGKRSMTYRLRAETPGEYRALPASAWLMYLPEIGGHSNETIFIISEEDQKAGR